jgi:hypothetical protein
MTKRSKKRLIKIQMSVQFYKFHKKVNTNIECKHHSQLLALHSKSLLIYERLTIKIIYF